MNFLSERTPRERTLILIAAILLGLFVIWQFGYKSVLNAHTAAEQRREAALSDLNLVRSAAPRLSPVQSDTSRAAFDRAAAINTARAAGLDISRIQPGANNTVQVWFDDSAMPQVYSFMTGLSGSYNVEITRVQMTRQDGSSISAQLTLKPIT